MKPDPGPLKKRYRSSRETGGGSRNQLRRDRRWERRRVGNRRRGRNDRSIYMFQKTTTRETRGKSRRMGYERMNESSNGGGIREQLKEGGNNSNKNGFFLSSSNPFPTFLRRSKDELLQFPSLRFRHSRFSPRPLLSRFQFDPSSDQSSFHPSNQGLDRFEVMLQCDRCQGWIIRFRRRRNCWNWRGG